MNKYKFKSMWLYFKDLMKCIKQSDSFIDHINKLLNYIRLTKYNQETYLKSLITKFN